MKNLFLTVASVVFAIQAFASDGYLIYENTAGVGKEKFVFGPSVAPNLACNSSNLADYAGRDKASGDGYWAELWYAPAPNAQEPDLLRVPNSKSGFRTGSL